jgi:hypothetical protein
LQVAVFAARKKSISTDTVCILQWKTASDGSRSEHRRGYPSFVYRESLGEEMDFRFGRRGCKEAAERGAMPKEILIV